jgi:hypothetical protein
VTVAEPIEHLENELDLENLPQPPRTMRTVTVAVMVVTAAIAAWLAWSIAPEAGYALRAPASKDVGVLAQADLASLRGEFVRGYVKLEGMPAASYRRPLEAGSWRIAKVDPGPDGAGVWVVHRVPTGHEGPRFVPPKLVAGRLAPASSLGVRFSGVGAVIDELGGKGGSDHVLVDGETPSATGWLLGLEVLLLMFVMFNIVSVVRLLRPVGLAAD